MLCLALPGVGTRGQAATGLLETWHGAAADCPVLREAGDSSSQGVCHASVLGMKWCLHRVVAAGRCLKHQMCERT